MNEIDCTYNSQICIILRSGSTESRVTVGMPDLYTNDSPADRMSQNSFNDSVRESGENSAHDNDYHALIVYDCE